MRIFFVCRRVPFPPNRGDKIATFNQIRHLSERHEVHVFCLGDGAHDVKNIPGLRDYASTITTIPVNGLKIKWRALKALIASGALSVAALNEPDLQAAIRRKHDELRPDLIIVYSSNMAQFAEHLAGVPRIMQFGDLDSLKWQQYANRSRIPLKWIYRLEQRRLFAYERHLAQTFSHSLVHTEFEKRDFERLIPGVRVIVVGNGVDLDYFRSAGEAKQPGAMIFTGVMNYRPNVDAVVWFCCEILPIVRSEIPAATLTICGTHPTAAVRRLARQPGVVVTGWVPDPRPYLDRAEIFVAPLRMARGVQNKLLEALAMGLPCVASTAARRGTVLKEGDGLLATDDPKEFATQIIRLLRDANWRAEMAHNARTAVDANYRWDVQMAHLDRVIASAAPQPPAHVRSLRRIAHGSHSGAQRSSNLEPANTDHWERPAEPEAF